MTIKVNSSQEIVSVTGADYLGYEDGDLLGQQLEMIIPAQHRAGHHAGFNRFMSTGVKKITGSWLSLPAVSKSGAEQNVSLVLTEEKGGVARGRAVNTQGQQEHCAPRGVVGSTHRQLRHTISIHVVAGEHRAAEPSPIR